MKIKKYVFCVLLCVSLLFVSCATGGLACLSLLIGGLTTIQTALWNPGSWDIEARALWLMDSHYTFKTIGENGIKVSIVMSRDGMDENSGVYYGFFGMDLDKMWKKPMDSMFSGPKSLIAQTDIKVNFNAMRVSYGGGAYFTPVDLNKTGTIEVFTNWMDDTLNYRYSPRHTFCVYNNVTPSGLLDTINGYINSTFDTASASHLRQSVDSGFVQECLMIKYSPTTALVTPPQTFILDFEIPVEINKRLSATDLMDKINN